MIAPEIAQHLPGIRAICKRQGVERMSFFGSAAREDFSPETSDVDCLIKFLKINKPGIADRYFNLIEGLEKTCHRPVDIVFEGTMKNYIFQKIVEKISDMLEILLHLKINSFSFLSFFNPMNFKSRFR